MSGISDFFDSASRINSKRNARKQSLLARQAKTPKSSEVAIGKDGQFSEKHKAYQIGGVKPFQKDMD